MSEWKKVKIGEFLTESKVLAEESDAAHRITVRLNCKGVEKRGLKAEKEGATKYYTRYAGQFIYGKQNIHKGAFGIIPPELDGFTSSADLPAFDIDESKCVPEWIPLCLKVDERYKTLQKEVKGVGSQRLAVNVFLNVEIPLPDVSVQRKVLAKVGEKITSIALLEDEIEKQKSYAKQLRQNILQEAIEGKLTADWRKQHPVQKGNPDYDTEALFDKIQAEMSEAKSTKKSLAPIAKDEIPFEIPTGWKWVRLGDISLFSSAGKSFNCESREAIGDEWGIIKTSAITSGVFVESENKFYSKKCNNDVQTKIQMGDLLFCRASGSKGLAGRSCVVEKISSNLLLSDKSIRIELAQGISKSLVNMLNNSQYGENYRLSLGTNKSTSMNNLTREQILNFRIPLPPTAEQKEIVARVEQYLQTITQLETQIATRETLTKQLMQSILKDAFEKKN